MTATRRSSYFMKHLCNKCDNLSCYPIARTVKGPKFDPCKGFVPPKSGFPFGESISAVKLLKNPNAAQLDLRSQLT